MPAAKKTVKKNHRGFERGEDGLLVGLEHKFLDDGSVDWKGMIPEEYVVVHEELVSKEVGEDQEPKPIDELEDYQKLVLLGGIKEVAKIRGLIRRSTKVDYTSEEKAVVTTEVHFIPNFETGGEFPLIYSDTASATHENAGGIGRFYLETIASNRSFVRAVRNALRIDIVGSDELNSGYSGGGFNKEEEAMSSGNKPTDMLSEKAAAKGYATFEAFKDRLIQVGGLKDVPLTQIEPWNEWKDIEPEAVWILLSMLNSAKTKK